MSAAAAAASDDLPIKVPALCNLVLIKNIPTNVFLDDMRVILNQLGSVKQIHLFPTDTQIGNNPSNLIDKICFVSMEEPSYNWLLLNLDGLSLGKDKISVELCEYDEIPADDKCLDILLNKEEDLPEWPAYISTKILKSTNSDHYIVRTINNNLESNGLAPYPDFKISKIDETQIQATRKTVSITNVKEGTDLAKVVDYLEANCGEILRTRKIEQIGDRTRIGLLVEFMSPDSVVNALKQDNVEFDGSKINVEHSIVSIIDPTEELKMVDQEIKEFKKEILKRKSRSRSRELIHDSRRHRRRRSRSRSSHRSSRRSPVSSRHDESRHSSHHRTSSSSSRRSHRTSERDQERERDRHHRHSRSRSREHHRSSRRERSRGRH
ncbi:MAG: Protein srek1IP1 [Marteilia pararefringens]